MSFPINKTYLAEDAGSIHEAERTVAEIATSVNEIGRHRMASVETKYPVEPPGSGTSSREAINLPIPKEKCDPAT